MSGLLPFVFAAGVAAAPPPPPCFVIHDETKMIFFEPGGVEIDPKASEVLAESAKIAIGESYQREIVTGFCDADESTAGSCPELARRRAEAAKAALVQLGLKAKRIETFTKADLFDPGDPRLNRRVVIDPILPPDDRTCSGQ